MNGTLSEVLEIVKRNHQKSLNADPGVQSFFDQGSTMVRNVYKECGVDLDKEKAALAIIMLGIVSDRALAYENSNSVRAAAIESSMFLIPWIEDN